jgi:selenocysteine-specific elongation factor
MGIVVGTAGHIDHGKTTLLRALTGIDADRLPEERRRGMTIDVGYAHIDLADGSTIDFVDVPGHDRLVGNMLVGAGEIDAAMLVIAADDGPRAQTLEHLELLDGLAITNGLVVVTKTDAVDAARVAEVVTAARVLVGATSLAGIPVIAVSASSGSGLSDLREALEALATRVLDRGLPGGASRLAIDRVFRVRGRGIVVTGTLRGSPLETGASLAVVPGDGTIRIRELQVHGRTVDRADPGRVAINVAGGDGGSLVRGTVLTADPAAVVASDRWLVALRPAVGFGSRPAGVPADRTRAQVHLGTARSGGVVGRAGRDGIDLGGAEVSAILRLETPLAVSPGDRFVLRRPSPATTLAGGRVLDPAPARGVSRRRTTAARLVVLAEAAPGGETWAAARLDIHGATDGALAPDVAVALDQAIVAIVGERREVPVAELRALAARVLRRMVSVETGRLPRSASDAIDRLVTTGLLSRDADRVRPAGATAGGPSPELVAAMDRLEAALATVAPPSLSSAARESGCSPAGIRELERSNRIVRLDDDLAWAFGTYRELASRALAMAASEPLTPAAYRDATGTSRKYVMAILEDLDRRAILRRTPDGHVPGPRAPQDLATADRSRT